MKIHLDDAMKKYMQEKGLANIVLETESKLCTTCIGFQKTVTLRFADLDETEGLLAEGYVCGETELGTYFYKDGEIEFGRRSVVYLKKMPWEIKFEFMGIRAVN